MPPGTGTVINLVAVLLGSGLGVLLGHRLPQRTRGVVTDALGLVTLVIAARTIAELSGAGLTDRVGGSAPMLIVLGALLLGGIVGSLGRLEDRVENLGARLQRVVVRRRADAAGPETKGRFIQGFVTSSLVFCVGPLTIVGSINEGLGRGADQLLLKSALDGFASIAFAASFGWGVAASVVSLVAIQGSLTALGAILGDFVPEAHLIALTGTGGVILLGVGLRLLRIRQVKVADLLPALIVAPLLTQVAILVH